jgi:hypothetical protein
MPFGLGALRPTAGDRFIDPETYASPYSEEALEEAFEMSPEFPAPDDPIVGTRRPPWREWERYDPLERMRPQELPPYRPRRPPMAPPDPWRGTAPLPHLQREPIRYEEESLDDLMRQIRDLGEI